MKYLKLKFLLIFAALAMAIPPAWAETVTLTLDDFPNLSNSYSSGTITKDGITFNYENFLKSGTSIQVKADFGTLSNETAFSGDITSVAITHSGTGRATTINGSSDGTNWTKVTSGNGSITGDFTGKGYKYFQITRGSNAAYWTKIEITYETGGPSLSVNKNELILKEPNGSFTVTGENLVDNVGVKQNPDGLFNLSFSSNLNWGFERDSENKVNGTVTVSYQGRDLTATGTIIPGTKNAEWTADIEAPVTVTYQPDLYIYCDLIDGQSWRYYPDEPQMTYDDGVYTKTVTITNPGSCILFARAAGLSYSWNDDRMFFGAKYDSDWVYGVDTSTGLGIYGSGNNNQYYPIKFNQAGVYTITINAANNTFSVTSTNVANIAEAQAFEGDTFTFMGNVVVTYQNGDNLWIRDIANRDGEIKSGLIYGDVDVEFANGDIVAPGWQAGNKLYNYYVPEFINPVGVTKGQGSGDGAPIALTTLDRVRDVNKYASISGVTITRVSSPNFYFEVDNTEYCLRDNFDMFDDLEVGHVYNVEGVVSVYSGNPQLWLTDVKEIKVLSVTLESETKTATVGETIPVTVNVANAEGNYTVTYKFGENGTENTLTGNTINVTSETAGDVTLYVTVTNNGNEATASETYTFTEPLTGNNVFTKVKSADQLVAGKRYIIVCGNKAMGSAATGNFLTAIDITAGDEVQVGDDVAIMTLAGTLGHYTLALGDEYLHAVSNTALGFGTSTEWAISNYNSSLTGFRVKHADYDRAVRYRSDGNRFGNYATSDAASDYGWIYVEKASTPQPELAVSLPEAPEEHYKVGQVVKVKATVENGSETTQLTYKVGEETLTVDNDGNVTLPNKKSGEVVLTVTAVDGDKEATDTKTYVFDKADALTITLTPATGTYYVGDEQNVTVTVEDAIDANPTITYKFGEEGEEQTYSAEGIVLPTTETGTINLIVMVDDNGYEHAGETTATGTYTVNNKPLAVTLTPANDSYTVGAEDTKVKVEITNALGTLVEDYKATYTVNEEEKTVTLTRDNEGYVTLPNDKAVTYTLTASVMDDREEIAEATGTYTFTAAPAIGITLTANPTQDSYTVGDGPTVTVGVTGTFGNDMVITYSIDRAEQEYNPETGIVIDRETAGDVTLTVNVVDGYDHEGAVNGITSKTATYNFTAAPAIEIGFNPVDGTKFDVGDDAKVSVTVEGSIGDDQIEILVNGEDANLDNEGKVILPNNAAGDVTVTVNVFDGYEHVGADENGITTASATYTFNKKEATVAFSEDAVETDYVKDGGIEEPAVTTTPAGLTLKYESSKPEVATVDTEGNVTIKGVGKTTITATFEGNDMYEEASDYYELTVNKADIEVSFNNETPDPITIGDDFTAPTLSEVPEGVTVTYKSSNENVAKVDENGNVTIVGPGTATITATVTGDNYNEATASYTITVNDVEVALAKPTFSPAAGTYTEPKQVAIACATPGVTIEYSMDGVTKTYEGPFTVDHSCTVTATATMGNRTVYTPATNSAQYTINAAPAIGIEDGYYTLQNNAEEVAGKYANVAGRRTLNFVANADNQAGTIFRIKTDPDTLGQIETLRSQGVDLQGYANRAMAYVPKAIELVLSKLATSSLGDPETPGDGILGENGLDLILEKFYKNFDYNLYIEQAEGGYRIYGKTPSMQHVVDFYHENTAQVEAKLPKLEGYINQVLDKIRNRIPAPYNANVVLPFSLKAVRDRIADKYGITLIDPVDNDSKMEFYRQVLNNKEYVWDFAYQTAMMYVDAIKGTQTYNNLPAEYKLYVEKMEKVRPDTKYYIIERGNELDYISENNIEIINNDPRTLWTITERETFKLSSAGELFGCPRDTHGVGGYFTTNYTDFAYTLPENVTAYKVTSVNEDGEAQLEALEGTIPAQTPVLLVAKEDGAYEVTLTTDAGTAVGTNLLQGPDYLITEYQIQTPIVVQLFSFAQGILGDNLYNTYVKPYEYLQLRYSGTVNNKYFWNVNSDLDDLNGDCVVRSLAVKDGELAFSDHWKTENNKAFMVSEDYDVIKLPSSLRGDVNHDGNVNIFDVTDLIDRILGNIDPTTGDFAACPYCSDVNENHGVNIDDVTDLIDILLANGVSTIVPDEGEGE